MSDLEDVADDCRRLASTRKSTRCDLADSPEPMHIWTSAELERADEYVRRWQLLPEKCGWWDLVTHLGDEPRGGWVTWSGRSNKIPTIRRSSGLYAWPAGHRHLTLRELHGAMGFPVTEALAKVARVPVYQVFRAGLSYSKSRQALGNSQLVPQIGCVAGCLLASCKYRAADDAMGLEGV